MGEVTAITWTDHTANFWMGCVKVSAGCKNCYAEALTENRMGLSVWGASATRQPVLGIWQHVTRWNNNAERDNTRRRVFCMSLGDFFEDHPIANELRPHAWDSIRESPMLDWQILTKRPERIADNLPEDWGRGWPHVWLGTSIEDNRVVARADILRRIPARVHFISYEPALGPLNKLNLRHIEWVIYGGESGSGYREHDLQWARDMRERCRSRGVAFFYKQASGARPGSEPHLDGETIKEFPL